MPETTGLIGPMTDTKVGRFAPDWLGGLAARVARLIRPPGGAAVSFVHLLDRARTQKAVLVVREEDAVLAAVTAQEAAVLVLPPFTAFDGTARFIKGLGGRTGRAARMTLRDVGEPDAPVPIIPFCADDPFGTLTDPLYEADVPLLAAHVMADRSWTVTSGFAMPVRYATAPVEAGLSRGIAAPARKSRTATLRDVTQALSAPTALSRKIQGRFPLSLLLRLYRSLGSLLGLLAPLHLRRRVGRNKEDAGRLGERRGLAGIDRPPGRLLWIHAASVGESVSVLPVVEAVLANRLTDSVLVTTGTVTSASVRAQRLPDGAVHQYAPLDVPRFVSRFLDHWRPDAAVLIESELWPTLMLDLDRRDIPIGILNGRMSERSAARWHRFDKTARGLLGRVRLVLAQSPEHARRFARLGAPFVSHIGNLKFDAPPPPVMEGELGALSEAVRMRPVWLAASTHEGEESQVAEAHIGIRDRFPNLLTIIVPRHPERGPDVVRTLRSAGLSPALRSERQAISSGIDVYVADTIGELGLFYRLVRIAFIGGSLIPHGGQNPIEPAHLDCAILHGPHTSNFRDVFESFDAHGGALCVRSAGALADRVAELLHEPDAVAAMIDANHEELERHAGALSRTVEALADILGLEATAGRSTERVRPADAHA